MPTSPNQMIVFGVIAVVVIGLMIFRMRRMVRATPYNPQLAWIAPAIFIVLTVFLVFVSKLHGLQWLWLAVTILIGAGLGYLRASTVKMSVDQATGRLMAQGSVVAIAFLFVLAAGRRGVEFLMESNSAAIGMSPQVINVLFLAMAMGLFVARGAEMFIRGNKLLAIHRSNPAVSTTEAVGV